MFSRIKATLFSGAITALTGIVLGFSPGHTQATPINFDIAGAPLSSASATLGPSLCFGCFVSTTLNPALDSIVFTLDQGQSRTFDFFRITVGGIGGAIANVTGKLAFDLPSGVEVVGHGNGAFVTFGGIVSAGIWQWNNLPSIITVSDGSQFSVDFSDIANFTGGRTAQVTATITAMTVAASPASIQSVHAAIPEPGTVALISLSLLGLIATRRRRARA